MEKGGGMSCFKILFQGDSITDCGRMREDTAGCCLEGMGAGYPGLIAGRLKYLYPRIDWCFFNRGISGNRIVDLYARWKIDTLHLEPDLLSILIGVNDSLHEGARGNGVEPERYERFYRELLSWTRRELPSCRFVLVEPFLIEPDEEKKAYQEEIAERGRIVRKLADDFNAVLIPAAALFADAVKRAPGHLWSPDGVHLLPAGHQMLADAWIETVKPFLPLEQQ